MKTEPQVYPQEVSRRGFYGQAIFALNAIMGAALALPTLAYLFIPKTRRSKQTLIDAGDINQLTPGVPVEMTFQQSRVDGWRVSTQKRTAWVVRTADEIKAFGPQCTHLGCAYHWDEKPKQFICPCHTSIFSIDGKVLAGPAPRPLDRYVSEIRNGRLLLGPLRQSEESTDATDRRPSPCPRENAA